jgi:hypothetical protein
MPYSDLSDSPLPDAVRGPTDGLPFRGFGLEDYELAPLEVNLEDGDFEAGGRRARFGAWGRWLVARVAWIGLAALLSLGSAGIVAAMARPPATGVRPELTYAADQALSDRLDAGVRDLATLNDDVIVLGQMARSVLASLSQVNQTGLDAAFQDGDQAVSEIDTGAARLKAQLDCGTWTSARTADLSRTYSLAVIDRWQQVCVAIDSVAPLGDAWTAMENGAKVAMQVVDDINAHDAAGADALQLATQGRYDEALTRLGDASAALANAKGIATTLATVNDVSVLTEWLSRSKTMDDALALLWQTMIDSKGRVTVQVTAALKAVNDAKALLPDNNDVLQVVVNEMSGQLTADALSIETAKGQLGSALDDLTGGSASGQ